MARSRHIVPFLSLGLGLLSLVAAPVPRLPLVGSAGVAAAATVKGPVDVFVSPAPELATPQVALPSNSAVFAAPGTVGVDVSFPQCDHLQVPRTASNGTPYTFAVIGVNHGRAFTRNPCLAAEYQALAARGMALGFVMNLNSPRDLTAPEARSGPAGLCVPGDRPCASYNHGWNAAQDAYADTQSTLWALGVAEPPRVWLMDIEVTNYWSPDQALNDQVLQGAIDFLEQATGARIADAAVGGNPPLVGVYSSLSQWSQIAGKAFRPAVAGWLAGARSLAVASRLCSSALMSGPTRLVQHATPLLDEDYAC